MRNSLLLIALVCCLMSHPAASAAETFKQAVADYNAGKYREALASFTTFKTKYPNNALTRYYLGLCHQALNHQTEAKAEYEWVSARGDATLKGHAATALKQLSGLRGSTGASPSPAPIAGGNAPAQAASTAPKVVKIIKWSAVWCGPCREFAPVYEATKSKYRDIRFEELDLDDAANADLKAKWNVNSVPRLIFLDKSGNVLYNGGTSGSAADFCQQIDQFR